MGKFEFAKVRDPSVVFFLSSLGEGVYGYALERVLIYSLLLFVWDFLSKPTYHCIEIAVLSDSVSKSFPTFQPNPRGRSILVTYKTRLHMQTTKQSHYVGE